MDRDPAARNIWEVLFLYPGLHALWLHRIAHSLYQHKFFFIARALSQMNRFLTQIEIHPGAKIGKRFFIDHGAGIVIGETSEIGNDVLMYQGVVLGGTTLDKKKRHPTIGNKVVIGARAIILGPITIGDCSRVGSGSVVIKSVPEGSTVVGVPGHVVQEQRQLQSDLAHDKLPDPVAEAIRLVLSEQSKLAERLKSLEHSAHIPSQEDVPSPLRDRIVHEFQDGEGI